MKCIIITLLFAFLSSFAANAETKESPKGLLNNHFYVSGLSWSRNTDTKDWSGGFSQNGWASIHPNINIGLSGDYTLASSQLDADEFFLSPYLRAHFLPEAQVDPYVTVGFGYGQSNLLSLEEDVFVVSLEVGAEARVSDLVSIVPSIGYEYDKFDPNFGGDVSGGYIDPTLEVAFRLGKDSRLWMLPFFSYDLKVHGDDELADVLSLGVGLLIQL